jgi:hypothetical protein
MCALCVFTCDAHEQDLLQQSSWTEFEAVRELQDRNAMLRVVEAAHWAREPMLFSLFECDK